MKFYTSKNFVYMKKLFFVFVAVLTQYLTAYPTEGDHFTVGDFEYEVLSEADHYVAVAKYSGSANNPSIPKNVRNYEGEKYTVSAIGEMAFSKCNITSVKIPETVTSIGRRAFYACPITSITIPDGVTSIGKDAFHWCNVLISVDMPDALTSIDESAFEGCVSLQSIDIPRKVKTIGRQAFADCSSLTAISIPESVESLGYRAFFYCSSLSSLTLSDSPISIGNSTFNGCASLTYVSIPAQVSYIGNDAFGSCSSLKAIHVDPGNSAYSSHDGILYNKDKTELMACPAGREEIVIPYMIKTIWSRALNGCSKLTNFVIPDSVSSIQIEAFNNCGRLATIVSLPSVTPKNGLRAFEGIPQKATIFVPKGSLNAYSTADNWKYFQNFREMETIKLFINEPELQLSVDETSILAVTTVVVDQASIKSELWTTSNPDVVTVDNGIVKAVGEGNATIVYTAIDGVGCPHLSTCIVEVSDPTGIRGIPTDDSGEFPSEYYNLNGVRVNAERMIPGIYIMKQGYKSKKILVM